MAQKRINVFLCHLRQNVDVACETWLTICGASPGTSDFVANTGLLECRAQDVEGVGGGHRECAIKRACLEHFVIIEKDVEASPGPSDGPHFPAGSSAAKELIPAVAFQARHADTGRHIELLQNLTRPGI